MNRSFDDPRASTTPAGPGLGGGPCELAPGRLAAEDADRPRSADRGPLVPGTPLPGTAAPSPSPTMGDGAALSPVSGALSGSDAPETGTSGREWLLEFPPGLKLLSLNGREHWAVRQRKARAIKDAATVLARMAKVPRLDRVSLAVFYDPPVQRRRDHDNLMATYKPVADGIVAAGVVPDDDIAHVLPPRCEVTSVIVPKGRLRVYVIEVLPAGAA